MAYDGQGNLTRKTNPAGYGVEAEYDRYGQVLGLKDERGPLLKNCDDPQGNLLEIVEAAGADATTTYRQSTPYSGRSLRPCAAKFLKNYTSCHVPSTKI